MNFQIFLYLKYSPKSQLSPPTGFGSLQPLEAEIWAIKVVRVCCNTVKFRPISCTPSFWLLCLQWKLSFRWLFMRLQQTRVTLCANLYTMEASCYEASSLTSTDSTRGSSLNYVLKNVHCRHCMVPFNFTYGIMIGGCNMLGYRLDFPIYNKTWLFDYSYNGNLTTMHDNDSVWQTGPDLIQKRFKHSCGLLTDVEDGSKRIVVAGGEVLFEHKLDSTEYLILNGSDLVSELTWVKGMGFWYWRNERYTYAQFICSKLVRFWLI